MAKSLQQELSDIVGDLRGGSKKRNWWGNIFVVFLLTFTAYNTFRLFGESFQNLGILLAIAAIGFFDGGFLFWGHQVRKIAKDFKQRAVASTMRWVCAGAAVSMTAIDMILHSGQGYIPLDAPVHLFGGWTATVQEVAGASAMFIMVIVLVANLMSISAFEDLDIDIRQAIKERVAENDARNRELAAFEAKSRLQNELSARMIEQMGKVGQDELETEANNLAQELLPEIRAEFIKELRANNQKRQQARILDGSFQKPKGQQVPPMNQPARAFAKEVDEERVKPVFSGNHNNQGKNRPNPPKA